MNSGLNVKTAQLDDYETPDWLFRALDAEFGFTFDAAASEKNSKCSKWTGDVDANPPCSDDIVFCNPPYSMIGLFVEHALGLSNTTWVLLLPVRTDNDWFHKLVARRGIVSFRFFRKRIRFCLNGVEQPSPRFASMLTLIR